MQQPGARVPSRRSTRIQEIIERKRVEEADRIAKLEAESKRSKPPSKPKATTKRKRSDVNGPSTRSGRGLETQVGAKGVGDLSPVRESPEKKRRTGSQQDEGSAEFENVPAGTEDHVTTPPDEEQQPGPVTETEAGAEGTGDPSILPESLEKKREADTQENEVHVEPENMPADTEEQVPGTTPPQEEPQTDHVTETHIGSKTIDESPTVPENLEKDGENGVSAGPENLPADKEVQAQGTTPLDEKQDSVDEGQQFLEVILSIVLILRQLRRKRAARRKCITEQSDLEHLLSHNWPKLANVPSDERYPGVRDDLRAKIQKYERKLRERHEQEADLDKDISNLNGTLDIRKQRMDVLMNTEVPLDSLPPSLKNDTDFREAYKYCRSLAHTVKDIEARLHEAEQDREMTLDKYYSQAGHVLLRDDALGDSGVAFEEINSHEQALRDSSGPHTQRMELEHDVSRTKLMCSAQKSALATLAEDDLIKRGRLQPYVSDDEEPKPEDVEKQKAVDQATATTSDSKKLKAERDAAKAELLSAQGHLCEAKKAFEHSRELTEEDIAQLPKSMTEDEIGLQLWHKLCRTTRDYREAQKRVKSAQTEGRRLRVPGVDRYPIDQTWDFEDRPEDGYADSAIAERIEKSKPRVEEWLPRLAMSGKPLSPSTKPETPKSLPDLGALQLGEDKADGCPSDGVKERIAKYQEACEDLRRTGEFPTAVPDQFILPENEKS